MLTDSFTSQMEAQIVVQREVACGLRCVVTVPLPPTPASLAPGSVYLKRGGRAEICIWGLERCPFYRTVPLVFMKSKPD